MVESIDTPRFARMRILPASFRTVALGAPRLLARLYAIETFLADIPPPGRVLEIGPGLGDLSAHLLERFPATNITLSEISPAAADQLAARFADRANVDVCRSNLLTGDGQQQAFDLLIACEVFEHIENDLDALHAAAGLLRPGGHFIFSAPCHMRKWQAADVFAGHFRRYERSELVDKFQEVGLAMVHLWTFGFPTVNLIQPFREFYYRKRNRAKIHDKQTATARSGIDRPPIMHYAKWAIIAGLLPVLPLERLFWHSDMGDGFLALARRL